MPTGVTSQLAAASYDRVNAARYGLSPDAWADILAGIVPRYPQLSLSDLIAKLHLQELALARACAAGNEDAWREFERLYRHSLRHMALGIARDAAAAEDLAATVFADLFGLPRSDGSRVSKFSYYHGRGSLQGWLRTVLAQQYIGERRRARPNVSLEAEVEAGRQFAARPASSWPAPIPAPQMDCAVADALASLPDADRALLCFYYLDGLTLAHIAVIFALHESTICRRLEKAVRSVRTSIAGVLKRRGWSERQIDESLAAALDDTAALDAGGLDLRTALAHGLARKESSTPHSPDGAE